MEDQITRRNALPKTNNLGGTAIGTRARPARAHARVSTRPHAQHSAPVRPLPRAAGSRSRCAPPRGAGGPQPPPRPPAAQESCRPAHALPRSSSRRTHAERERCPRKAILCIPQTGSGDAVLAPAARGGGAAARLPARLPARTPHTRQPTPRRGRPPAAAPRPTRSRAA